MWNGFFSRCFIPFYFFSHFSEAVLGTYATFSATVPLARTEKVARRGGDKVKNNGAVALARKIVAS